MVAGLKQPKRERTPAKGTNAGTQGAIQRGQGRQGRKPPSETRKALTAWEKAYRGKFLREFDAHTKTHWGMKPAIATKHTWAGRERGQFDYLAKKIGDGESLRNFLRFAIENWATIVRLRLHWLKDAPQIPDLGFLVRFLSVFHQAYQQLDNFWQQYTKTITGDAMVTQLVRQGWTLEDAQAEIQARKAGPVSQEQQRVNAIRDAAVVKIRNAARQAIANGADPEPTARVAGYAIAEIRAGMCDGIADANRD